MSENDATVLGHIGTVLFREGLRRRMDIRPGGISEEQRNLYGLALEGTELRSPNAAAFNQLNTVSARSDDGGLRRLVKSVADAYGAGRVLPAPPQRHFLNPRSASGLAPTHRHTSR